MSAFYKNVYEEKNWEWGVKATFVGVPIYFVGELEIMEILGYRII